MRSASLLIVTIVIAVALAVGMWLIDVVTFSGETFAFHVISIYIGVAGVLLFQLWRDRS